MNFNLTKPCQHCPFRREGGIRFACRSRAEEIEELAYRQGFVCHKTGEEIEMGDEETGVDFRADGTSEHCAGATLMFMKDGGLSVPLEQLTDEEMAALEARLDWGADVFDCAEDFFEANEKAQ